MRQLPCRCSLWLSLTLVCFTSAWCAVALKQPSGMGTRPDPVGLDTWNSDEPTQWNHLTTITNSSPPSKSSRRRWALRRQQIRQKRPYSGGRVRFRPPITVHRPLGIGITHGLTFSRVNPDPVQITHSCNNTCPAEPFLWCRECPATPFTRHGWKDLAGP
jgi:hypothetical protein